MSEPNSTVTVDRTSDIDCQVRQIILTIDGEPFATLLFGKSATKPIAPGRHKLVANNTLVKKSIEFDLADGEHARFQVINKPGRWTYPLVALLGVGPIYLAIEKTSGS